MNVPSDGDRSTQMVVALINGQYDLALTFLARGANPNLANDDGVTALFATLNNEWALRTWYPQRPMQVTTTYRNDVLENGAYPRAEVPETVTTIVPILPAPAGDRSPEDESPGAMARVTVIHVESEPLFALEAVNVTR